MKLESKRNFGLDLIRVIAISLVVIAHLGYTKAGGLKIGNIGVEVFFVLSGFLIGQILIKDFKEKISPAIILNFWQRRWFRTLPMYYLVIILKFIFLDHSLGFKLPVYFLFLQNNFVGIDFFPVSWSLVIEEWFYLLLPIMLIVLFRKGITPFRFILFLTAFICFENAFRFGWIYYTHRTWSALVGNFPFRLDSLMVGVLLAGIKLFYNKVYTTMQSFWFFCIGLGATILLLFLFHRVGLVEGLKDQLYWTRTIWFSLISCCFASMFPYIEQLNVNEQGLLKKVVTQISLLTYSIYLLHADVFHFVISQPRFTFYWSLQALLAVGITICLSYIAYRFYELPMTNLRDRKRNKKTK